MDIAILDVMLPDIDGFEVCRRIRGSGSRMGIIMLTALSQENDKINGFMTGADDYVGKPFSVVELVARVDALYRRLTQGSFNADLITSGPFSLNLRSRELKKKRSPHRADPGGIPDHEELFGKPGQSPLPG